MRTIFSVMKIISRYIPCLGVISGDTITKNSRFVAASEPTTHSSSGSSPTFPCPVTSAYLYHGSRASSFASSATSTGCGNKFCTHGAKAQQFEGISAGIARTIAAAVGSACARLQATARDWSMQVTLREARICDPRYGSVASAIMREDWKVSFERKVLRRTHEYLYMSHSLYRWRFSWQSRSCCRRGTYC